MRAIRQARAGDKLDVSVRRTGRGLEAQVTGIAAVKGDVVLVRFINEATTEVANGENHGKTLVSRHIVHDLQSLGVWRGGAGTYTVPTDSGKAPLDCAVIVQSPRDGPILGAALCPKQPSS